MAFLPRIIEKFLDMANLKKHNDNYSDIKAELDKHDTHVANKKNPHEVTAAQVGAETPTGAQAKANAVLESLNAHKTDLNNPHGVTPALIGAETPVGAQAKATIVQDNLDTHIGNGAIHTSQAEKDKLSEIEAKAEVNQNAFTKIAVSGQSDVDADSKTDTLNFAGGTGITVTTNPLTDTLTITATGEATPGAHALSHITGGSDIIPDAVENGDSGLMSGSDKASLLQAIEDIGVMGVVPTTAKDAAGAITELYNELENITEESTINVPITHGNQIIAGGNAPALAFPKVDGRTLINPLGGIGSMSDTSKWASWFASTLTVDTSNFVYGQSSIKAVAVGTDGVGVFREITAELRPNSYYIAVAEIKSNKGMRIRFNMNGLFDGLAANNSTRFAPSYVKFVTPAAITQAFLYVINSGANVVGDYAFVDGVRFYEISAEEYAAINDMTTDQVAAKYPYVGTGIYGVKDTTVTSVQDNLIPPFSEWAVNTLGNSKFTVNSPYSATLVSMDGTNYGTALAAIPIEPITTYTLDAQISKPANAVDGLLFYWLDRQGNRLASETTASRKYKGTHVSPSDAFGMQLYFTMDTRGETQTVSNPMLVKGSIVQPFKPQNKTSLTAYTELNSNVDGSVKDTLEYVSGKPKKVKRFEKVVLDGSYEWVYNNSSAGVKRVGAIITNNWFPHTAGKGILTKYNGKLLTLGTSVATTAPADTFTLWSDQRVYLDIASTDSGWGDAYVPTADEIKAYFNGWVMTTQESWNTAPVPYNGTGTKGWLRRWVNDSQGSAGPNTGIGVGVVGSAKTVLPTAFSYGFPPYNLLYQLATPVIEDVQTGGAAVIERGDNHITLASTNVQAVTASLTYADSVYSALSDVEREIARVDVASQSTTIIGDANEIVRNGVYYSLNKNNPTYDRYYIHHQGRHISPELYSSQIAISVFYNRMYFRRKDNGVWSDWVESWTTANNAAILAANGYQKLASGLIMQWGVTVLIAPNTLSNITFPIAFPNGCKSVTATVESSTVSATSVESLSTNICGVRHNDPVSRSIRWIAIGY